MAKLNKRVLIVFTIIFAQLMISYITHSKPARPADYSAATQTSLTNDLP